MKWLLPEYVEDILPAEAMRIERLRRSMLDLFFAHKYQLVMPPLLEYMDSLLTGTAMTSSSAPSRWSTSSPARRWACAPT